MKFGLAVFALLLAFLWQAEAVTYSATISSGFSGCAGASSPVYQPTSASACSYSASSSLASVRWGVPASNGGQRSGLQFEPPSGTVTLNTDVDTYIGKLTHFNFPLSDATHDSNSGLTEIPSVVQLKLSVLITLPTGNQLFTPQFPLQVQETVNQASPLTGGICQQAVNNTDWNLPSQGITGWNTGLPCCPYGSTIACSDKITFNSLLDVSSSFDDGTSKYTLQLDGFKGIQSPNGTAVNDFISQEQQNSVAYLYARLSVRCTGDSSCTISGSDTVKQCKVGSCNSASGVCVFNPNAALNNKACPIGITNPHPLCEKAVCLTGSCVLQNIAGSDGQFCNSSSAGRPADSCTVERCNSGICLTQASSTSPNCTELTSQVTQYGPCTEQRCVNNKCTLRGLDSRSCTPSGAWDSACSRGSCKKKTLSGGIEVGTCTLKRTNTGNGVDQASCTSTIPGGQQCKWVQCEATTNYPAGSCTYSFISQNTNCGNNTNACKTSTCNNRGTCVLANKSSSTSCTLPASVCKTAKCDGLGTCKYSPLSSSTSCSSLTPLVCKNQFCDGAGSCVYVNQTVSTTCNNLTAATCKNQACDGNGNCVYVNQNNGTTCNSLGAAVCKSQACYGGVCVYVPQSTSTSCSSLTPLACKNQFCDGTGNCVYVSKTNGTTCNNLTASACKNQACYGGVCTYVNQANMTACSSLTPVACQNQFCDGAGNCRYLNETGAKVACSSLSSPSSSTCMKRYCKPGQGTCTYSVVSNPGSCSSISSVTCQTRYCKGTSTSYTAGAYAKCALQNKVDNTTCNSFGAHVCYLQQCKTGKCTKVNNPSYTVASLGTCASTPTLGTTATSPVAVAAVACKKRTCDTQTAACVPQNDSGQDNSACSGPNAGDCTASQCLGGTCGIRNVSTGSCQNLVSVSPQPNDCIQRLCGQAGKPAGQCGLVISSGGSCARHWATQYNNGSGLPVDRSCVNLLCSSNGTCYISVKSNGTVCGTSNPCQVYTCQGGVCVITNKANGVQSGCTGTTGQCKRPECVNGVCTQNVVYNVGGSCTTISSATCNSRLCDATGTCKLFYNNNPSQSCGNDGINSGCTVMKCGNMTTGTPGKGTCMDYSSTVTGENCGSTIPGACYQRQCVSGQCVKRANPSLAGQSCEIAVHCSSKREEFAEPELHSLQSRALLPAQNGSSDCQPKAADDAGCYTYQCSNGGQCMSVSLNNNLGCGPTPPNAIQNGTSFACKQYVCSAGTCNTNPAATVDILEGEYCSGFQPCDPTTDGCNDECQTYVCHSGLCELDLREGESCNYPKRPTYRRAQLKRDEILVPTECQDSKCRGGRCAVESLTDGTSCGDRQNNSCTNDTCISGQCVLSETNCSYVQAPSVCFDVTCDPSTGECGYKLNGRVDCTCISDCNSCTKVHRLVNSTDEDVPANATAQAGACWWCPGAAQPGCYNRIDFETGEVVYYIDPTTGQRTDKPDASCVDSESDCASGSSDLTGGEIAGIVVAAVAVSSIAAAALGAAIVGARFLQAASTAGEDAILTDVAFESNAADNPFHQSKWTQSDLVGSIAADAVPSAHFVTN